MKPENPSPAFWLALETVPGGLALPTIWMHKLDFEFDSFKSLFLKPRPDELADFVPCPWKCGCFHKVVLDVSGCLYGVCQCANPRCDTYTVVHSERIPLELDWSKMARVFSRAFGLTMTKAKLGLFNTLQIALWSPAARSPESRSAEFYSAVSPSSTRQPPKRPASPPQPNLVPSEPLPVLLTLSSSRPELLANITFLIKHLSQPFILLAPTSRHLAPAAKELLASTGSGFFALEDHLRLDTSGNLVCSTPADKLFAEFAPLRPEPSDDDLARRAFLALQEADNSRRHQPPSLYRVFHLYCVEELSIPQIARKCRCSLGTVANRLNLLRAKTGAAPDQLRRVSPLFTKFEDDLRTARRNYKLRTRSS
jgi:hypothetical protein